MGEEIAALDGRPPHDLAALEATNRIVAMAGIHPYVKLLDAGAHDHRRPQQGLGDVCRANLRPSTLNQAAG